MATSLVHGLALLVAAAPAAPPQEPTDLVRGTVIMAPAVPVERANVFLLETLEGALTDTAGRFAFRTTHRGPATLIVRGIGLQELRVNLVLPTSESLLIEVFGVPIELDPITVEAWRVLAADTADVALTSLGVVTTPGAAADVYRAIQTYPGLQMVDEGAGLFVRGGDVAETRVYLNDALVISPYRYESPTGGFFGAFDPFLLDGIAFSTGGFGARYGNALSAVAELRTQGRPTVASGGLTASLAALSGSAGLPLPGSLGLRAAVTRSNTALMFDLNGSASEFTQVPEGRDLSGSLTWTYAGGELRAFAMDQWSRLGVLADDEAFTGAFDADERHALYVTSWRDTIGFAAVTMSGSVARTTRAQSFGAFQLDQADREAQLRGRLTAGLGARLRLTLGGEVESRRASFAGSIPESADDKRAAARRTLFAARVSGDRHAIFSEVDWLAGRRWRVTAGLRSDYADLSGRRTLDPRVAVAARLAPGATLTAAWGIYHQIPEPFYYEPTTGRPGLGPMRAVHWVGGAQLEGYGFLLRGEVYLKTYRDLAQRSREFAVVEGGRGESRGVDAFLRWTGRPGLDLRISYSFIRARRTDPDTQRDARSPFDITHVYTAVVERTFAQRWRVSSAYRRATGRPFTPVVAATPDPTRGVWTPTYGPAMSGRLPPFRRLDLAGSYLHSFWPGTLSVFFVGVTNLLDRENVYGYRYSADYRERLPIRSQFKRSIYFGTSLTF